MSPCLISLGPQPGFYPGIREIQSKEHLCEKENPMGFLSYLFAFLTPGSFLYVDLFAAFTNALNCALLAQRPDH